MTLKFSCVTRPTTINSIDLPTSLSTKSSGFHSWNASKCGKTAAKRSLSTERMHRKSDQIWFNISHSMSSRSWSALANKMRRLSLRLQSDTFFTSKMTSSFLGWIRSCALIRQTSRGLSCFLRAISSSRKRYKSWPRATPWAAIRTSLIIASSSHTRFRVSFRTSSKNR